MTSSDNTKQTIAKLPIAASVVALVGLADAVYLTIHHYTAEAVPCGAEFDCGAVLNSSYAEIAGIPLAAFGAAAYFVAFSLALLTAFGERRMWKFYGVQASLMAAFQRMADLRPIFFYTRMVSILSCFRRDLVYAFPAFYRFNLCSHAKAGLNLKPEE